MNELHHLILDLFNLFGMILFIVLYFLADRKLRKDRELRHLIITSHERFRRDLLAAGKLDASAFEVNRPHAVGETGDVERPLGAYVEYAGEWTPSPRVFFSEKDPSILTFVLETDLHDLDADMAHIDGFDLILRPFAKPIRDNALEKGHVRLWLAREPPFNKRPDGRDSGNDASSRADNLK